MAVLFSHLHIELHIFHFFSLPPVIFWFPFSFFVFHSLFSPILFLILLSSTSTSSFPSLLCRPLLPFSYFPRSPFLPSSCPDLRSCTVGVRATCRASVYLSACKQGGRECPAALRGLRKLANTVQELSWYWQVKIDCLTLFAYVGHGPMSGLPACKREGWSSTC